MKSIITFLMVFGLAIGHSQVTNEGNPESWRQRDMADVAPIVMPGFDLETLRREDAVNDLKKEKPYRFGHQFLVDYNLENSGKWETLENGDRVWRIRFYSEGAKTMNFIFSDFYMPRGASLYLYNNDRSDLLGAYDSEQNNEKRVLGTWLVNGSDIWIEYYEPKAVKNQGKLEVFKVVHGYRSAEDFTKSTQDIGDSGACHYDVNCTMGTIDAKKDISKRSVAMMVVGGSGFCTGALINNVANNGTRYFLTANHCYEEGIDDTSQWAFRFNWVSPNPVCATFGNSANGPYHQTASGAILRARRAQTDFILVQISANLPASWDLVWSGWNRANTATGIGYTYGIHHPSGDIMKVSLDSNAPAVSTDGGMSVWRVNSWDKGVTEPGSSGSPLFDPQGRILGQLYGGTSFCNGMNPDTGSDIYGRIGVSWDAGFSANQRLKDWLDPTNTNVMTLDAYIPNAAVEEVAAIENEVNVYPNPSNGVFTVALGNLSSLQYEIYNVLGQSVKAGELTSVNNTLNLTTSQNGIYILKLVDKTTNRTVTRKIVKE